MRPKSHRYLNLRGHSWRFKRDIPAAIRHAFDGLTAYIVELGTSDVRVAMERRDDIARETDALFRRARLGGSIATGIDHIREKAEFWAEQLKLSHKAPMEWSKRMGVDADEDADALTPQEMIEAEAERIAASHGQAAERRFVNMVHGHVDADHYLEQYLKEARLAPKTTAERRNLVKRFAQWAGAEGLSIPDIDRTTAGEYYTAHIAPLHTRTAKKHHGAVKLYWDYLKRRGYATGENPWEHQALPQRSHQAVRGDKVRERPFTAAEMQALLYPHTAPPSRKDNPVTMDHAMRIGALTGMRLGEIVTLWVEECVIDADGMGYFDIQQGKTAAAARRVPIHPELIELVQGRIAGKKPRDWLFPELAKLPNPADTMGKRFRTYRESLNVDDKRPGHRRSLVNFHSFRRWFVTEAERAGQQESTISAVVGHEEGRKSITFGTYSGGPSDDQKRRCVEAVRLPPPAPLPV